MGAEGPRGPRVETQRRGGVRERERETDRMMERKVREKHWRKQMLKKGGGGGKREREM